MCCTTHSRLCSRFFCSGVQAFAGGRSTSAAGPRPQNRLPVPSPRASGSLGTRPAVPLHSVQPRDPPHGQCAMAGSQRLSNHLRAVPGSSVSPSNFQTGNHTRRRSLYIIISASSRVLSLGTEAPLEAASSLEDVMIVHCRKALEASDVNCPELELAQSQSQQSWQSQERSEGVGYAGYASACWSIIYRLPLYSAPAHLAVMVPRGGPLSLSHTSSVFISVSLPRSRSVFYVFRKQARGTAPH